MSKQAKNKSEQAHDELKKYYVLGLPLLGLMALIAVAGLVATVLVRYFFKA